MSATLPDLRSNEGITAMMNYALLHSHHNPVRLILLPILSVALINPVSLQAQTAAPTASATSVPIVVNSLSDDSVACAVSGVLCLRNAVAMANASPTPINITFKTSGTITLGSPLILNNQNSGADISIDSHLQQIIIDGGKKTNILVVKSNTTLTLNGLVIKNGYLDFGGSEGAGILNYGTVTITNSVISDNVAVGAVASKIGATYFTFGGGISNNGTLNIINSTLSNNSANEGGGISSGGDVTITNSILSDNSADTGGAISAGGTLMITNSTISNNSAKVVVGGILNSGKLTMTSSTLSSNVAQESPGGLIRNAGGLVNIGTAIIINSTVYGNSSARTGGINNFSGDLTLLNSSVSGNSSKTYIGGIANSRGTDLTKSTLTISNSIVIGNTDKLGTGYQDIAGNVNSLGHNLIGDVTNAAGFIDTDQTGVSDAKLGTLGNYGGSTQTIALLPGSPAIGKGDCGAVNSGSISIAAIMTDQRGVPRGNPCSIGAFEGSAAGISTGTITATPGS